MKEPTVIHNTFVIERRYAASPERVFAALSEPGKKQLWYAGEERNKVERFEMDFRVGGAERLEFRLGADTPFPGTLMSNEGTYADIVPNSRIVMTCTMSLGERRITVSLITFEILPTENGSDLIFTHQGAFFEGSGGPAMREVGWQKLIDKVIEQI